MADQIAELRDIGVRNLMLKLNTGEMDTHKVQKSTADVRREGDAPVCVGVLCDLCVLCGEKSTINTENTEATEELS